MVTNVVKEKVNYLPSKSVATTQDLPSGMLSDIWLYNTMKDEWNYRSTYFGINEDPSYKGTLTPGSVFAASAWYDGNETLVNLNTNIDDLTTTMWARYEGEWTIMHGPTKGVQYGNIGVPSFKHSPGNRFLTAHWKDNKNNFWVYGGIKGDNSIFKFDWSYTYGDLWMYNAKSGWKWVRGEKNPNHLGFYGLKGHPSPYNTPAARSESAFASNLTHAVLFGGFLPIYQNVYFNDMWILDMEKNIWTWIAGQDPQITDQFTLDEPCARSGSMIWWDNEHDIIYMYGGNAYERNMAKFQFGDMWMFDLKTMKWSILIGDTPEGYQYSFNETYPGPLSHASTWIDSNGSLWMFGGENAANYSNVLWHYNFEEVSWNYVSGSQKHDTHSIIGGDSQFTLSAIIISLSVLLCLVVIVLVVFGLLYIFRRNKSKNQVGEEEYGERLLIQRIRDEEEFDPFNIQLPKTIPSNPTNSSTINWRHLKLEDRSSRGKCGPVWRGTYYQTPVAVHEIRDLTADQLETLTSLIQSYTSMVPFEYMIQIIGSCIVKDVLYVIEEWVGNDLLKFVSESHTVLEILDILRGITLGMSHMHDEKLFKRLLSTQNILISSSGVPKIRPFSYYDQISDENENEMLSLDTLRYMSPEAILSQKFSESSDAWSFGILICECFSGCAAFSDVKNALVLSLKITNERLTPKIPNNVPDWLVDIVQQCWDSNPMYRPTFQQLYRVLSMNITQ